MAHMVSSMWNFFLSPFCLCAHWYIGGIGGTMWWLWDGYMSKVWTLPCYRAFHHISPNCKFTSWLGFVTLGWSPTTNYLDQHAQVYACVNGWLVYIGWCINMRGANMINENIGQVVCYIEMSHLDMGMPSNWLVWP